MKVSKNIWKGAEITNLAELQKLAVDGKSVVVKTKFYTYVKPAAFMINWPLCRLLNLTFFHAINKKDFDDPQDSQ